MSAFVFTGVRLRIAGFFCFSVILFADLRIFFIFVKVIQQ